MSHHLHKQTHNCETSSPCVELKTVAAAKEKNPELGFAANPQNKDFLPKYLKRALGKFGIFCNY